MKISKIFSSYVLSVFLVAALLHIFLPKPAHPNTHFLKKSIISYNTEMNRKSLSKGTYLGEEGALSLRPEVAEKLGLNAYVDNNYLTARKLSKQVVLLFEQIVEALRNTNEEETPGEHVKKVAEFALRYNKASQDALEMLMAYRTNLMLEKDERLDASLCSELLEKLLLQCLEKASYNLRDALGYLYNLCQDIDKPTEPLTSQNIKFVNRVFREFLDKASKKALKPYDLDSHPKNRTKISNSAWKRILGPAASRCLTYLEPALKKQSGRVFPVDPLLFLALMRKESAFRPKAISYVGAAGLTQIMPKTAKDLGMKKIFMPTYFNQAGKFLLLERKLRRKAIKMIGNITSDNSLTLAKKARSLMQESIEHKKKRAKLYSRYKRELLKRKDDERLNPRKAVEYGLRFFANQVKRQKGDISLALASYNAGPHRIKQYKGIPPYDETVSFRNGVLRYYREYLKKLHMFRSANAKQN